MLAVIIFGFILFYYASYLPLHFTELIEPGCAVGLVDRVILELV